MTPTRQPSRVRELVAGLFAGTPGRLRLFGTLAIVGCLLFGALAFAAGVRIDTDIRNARNHAAQLVRVQTIRTNLVKADANATNAFLVGGLEPTAARAAYTTGISTAARSLAEAASANSADAPVLENVNRVLANYTGLIESARSNNRQGFPIGAAYLRDASDTIQQDALPPLAKLVAIEQARVNSSADAVDFAPNLLFMVLVVALVVLGALQIWLYRKTHRVLNPGLLTAFAIVLVAGLVGLGVMAWSRSRTNEAHKDAYRQTVALATGRINGFDAKSAEALTLINRGSGQPFEERFKTVSGTATRIMSQDLPLLPPETRQARTVAAFSRYLTAHTQVRKLDDAGSWDQAVALATGTGAANRRFATFETLSAQALNDQATKLSNELHDARLPLIVLPWLLLLAGIAAAAASWRGINQRLREYR